MHSPKEYEVWNVTGTFVRDSKLRPIDVDVALLNGAEVFSFWADMAWYVTPLTMSDRRERSEKSRRRAVGGLGHAYIPLHL